MLGWSLGLGGSLLSTIVPGWGGNGRRAARPIDSGGHVTYRILFGVWPYYSKGRGSLLRSALDPFTIVGGGPVG